MVPPLFTGLAPAAADLEEREEEREGLLLLAMSHCANSRFGLLPKSAAAPVSVTGVLVPVSVTGVLVGAFIAHVSARRGWRHSRGFRLRGAMGSIR